ncbi:histidine--tRNA ligase [Halostagnicola kamekurae]|uniref:Histidine--tRNA ligase n=1 Tax=Halostagnicola kamekurae TaxID=619731 RepID=A0A1I6PKN6_9EURY|nr:histidine--tRNA ligase [Halostagnicola kamekurae]SFS40791.1 histidyl-tRNA synthetase [Halostagnicola kamekurae]
MYDRIKGFRDVYPDEMAARRRTIDTIEETARQYGFREIETPALERAAMWTDKSGDDIVDELYSFEDQGGRHVTLTPELTPTVARMVVAKQQELSKPIKWFSTRPFWRYEQVQQGRQREFYQTNVDIFGSSEPEADAEILAWAADAMTGLGLDAADFDFRISHRDILGGVLETYDADIDTEAAIRAVDKSDKIPRAEYHDLLVGAGLTAEQAEEFDDLIAAGDLEAVEEFASTERVTDAVENLRNVLEAAEDFGVREYCTISLETARGLDYYTGIVFECFDSAGEVSRSIFGGGRYDDLIEQFGGQPTPAVGVAPGHATLSLLLQRADVWPEEAVQTDYYVLQVGDTRSEAARITRALRDRGHVVETDIAGRSFGAQLEYADSINAETTVIVGEQDLANDEVTIKEMESGDQVQAPVEEFPGDLKRPTAADFS